MGGPAAGVVHTEPVMSAGSPRAVPPTDLPVEEVVDDLRRALADPGHAVLVAPPGAGKTTLVPLRLLDEPWLENRGVVMLEPRRLAARAAARRLAHHLDQQVGLTVGFRTRDERKVGPATRIEVVTEGILVRRLQRDPSLDGTGLVILDEVHERNLFTDLSLALVLDARSGLRPDLRILAMSATVDTVPVAATIGGLDAPAPVIVSTGRNHPLRVRWAPPEQRDRLEGHVTREVVRALRAPADRSGDVLVFLPGTAEIERTARSLRAPGVLPAGVEVHPLHGSLPTAEQDRALAPSPDGARRVVLSTDIAETSLTVAGVRTVVDAGLVRGPRFDAALGLTRLVTKPASQAAADQRAGRAARLGPGTVHRMWSEADHLRRPRYPEPELAVTDLTGLALELAVWGAPPADLPLIDQPPSRAWDEGVALLGTLGAVDGSGRPTPRGRAMAELPLHPRLAAMVVEASTRAQGWHAALVAALLDERDVLGGRADEKSADLAERVALMVGRQAPARGARPGGDGATDVRGRSSTIRTVARRARELGRRAGVSPGEVDPTETGPLVALAYPDRIAQARGRGRFRLRGGGGGWLPETDPLAAAPWLAVADLAVGDGDGRIRAAAAIDRSDVEALVADDLTETTEMRWDNERDDLRVRRMMRAGSLVLAEQDSRPEPGPATVAALLERVRSRGLDQLRWSRSAADLRQRMWFLHSHDPQRWPDVSDSALLADLDDWLGPHLVAATGRADLEKLDLAAVLRSRLDHVAMRDLERLTPSTLPLAGHRSLKLTYGPEGVTARVRVQDLYGTKAHPTVVDGRVPVVLHLLSPADRPVQVTADLPGFWAGTWSEVRKEMAGRYPKHPWPSDPAGAEPPAERVRRR